MSLAITMTFKIHTLDVQNQLQNYIWLIEHQPSKTAIVIDPTEADIVETFCHTHQLTLSQIWLTHWHKDHVGGVPNLMQNRQIPVYGPEAEQHKIPWISHPLNDQQTLHFQGMNVQIMAVPGHTLGHIVYFAPDINSLFCGDTLFAMGCGRVFEGTYQQMYQSLQKLKALPEATLVYCTHEYTQSNAAFGLHVDPDNLHLQERAADVAKRRQQGQCTLPSTIALERQTNVFLRAENVAEFQRLRELKDQF